MVVSRGQVELTSSQGAFDCLDERFSRTPSAESPEHGESSLPVPGIDLLEARTQHPTPLVRAGKYDLWSGLQGRARLPTEGRPLSLTETGRVQHISLERRVETISDRGSGS